MKAVLPPATNLLFSTLLMLSLSAISFPTVAASLQDPHNLCVLEQSDEVVELNFTTESIAIADAAELSPFTLHLLNDYLHAMEFTDHDLTLAEIHALFGRGGEQDYNELHFLTFTSKTNGEVLFEALSYPGDNPVGRFYDSKGELIGYNDDDSLSVIIQGQPRWCGDL